MNTMGAPANTVPAAAHPGGSQTPIPYVSIPPDRQDPVLSGATIGDRLVALHDELRHDPPLAGVGRVAAALYEPSTGMVKTFIHATEGQNPLGSVAMPLDAAPLLREIMESGRPRSFNDLDAAREPLSAISRAIRRGGFRSRLVVPIIHQGEPFGFLFFNAEPPGYFDDPVLEALRPHIRTISMMLVHERAMVRTMLAAVRTARTIGHHRDEETGGHLERMARYARMIAESLAPAYGLSDEYVEYLFQYAPLHDIGKVAVPDVILLKAGKLTEEEYAIMKTHVAKGVEIIDQMQRDIGLTGLPYAQLLRNVVGGHHEAVDGSGYPGGLAGEAIPLEARITAVADVFDALTSRRPYKDPWSNERALSHMTELSGRKFDADCIAALAARSDRVQEIQAMFSDSRGHGPLPEDMPD